MNAITCLLLFAVPLAAQRFYPTRHAHLPAIPGGLCFARGDLDGGGDLDLVVANDYAASQVLLNDGNGLFVDATAGRLVSPAVNDAHAIALADLDGDGDLDLVVGHEDYVGNRVYRNNGAAVFSDVTATALPTPVFDTKNLVLADFDGDGDVDLLTVDHPQCHYYANNGTGVFTDVSSTRLVGLGSYLGQEWLPAAPAADLDGDGDPDVLLDGGGMLRNQAGVLSPFPSQLPGTATAPHWIVDVDGDGDLDVFAARRYLFRNQGNATFVDVTAMAFPTPPIQGLGAFDLDRDGDVDLVTQSTQWRNNGTGSFTATGGHIGLRFGDSLGAMAADFDGDGDIDLPGVPNFLRQVHADSPPTRSDAYVVEFHTRPGVTSSVGAFAALGPGFQPVGAFGVLRLDPATLVTLSAQNVAASPLAFQWPIPNVPALAGTALQYQGCVLDPIEGPVLTNTIRDVVQ